MYVLGLHYSVKLDDILKTCLYRAEMCLKLCEEASAKVPANTHTHTHTHTGYITYSGTLRVSLYLYFLNVYFSVYIQHTIADG